MKKKRNLEGMHLVQLYLKEDKWQEIKLAADSVQEPITTFCRRAIYGTLRNWKAPSMKAENWSKCTVCGKRHNEQDHYRQD